MMDEKGKLVENMNTYNLLLVSIGIIGISAGAPIFVLVAKFKALRTATYFYVLNLLVWTILYNLVRLVLLYSLVAAHTDKLTFNILCGILRVNELCLIQMCLFCILLACDSFLHVCKENLSKRLHKNWKITLACTNLLGLMLFGCLLFKYDQCVDVTYIQLLIYFLALIMVILASFLQSCKPPKYTLGIGIVCIILYAPMIIIRLILIINHGNLNDGKSIMSFHLGVGLLFVIEAAKGCVPAGIALVVLFNDRTVRLILRKIARRNLSAVEEQELHNYPIQNRHESISHETQNLNTPDENV